MREIKFKVWNNVSKRMFLHEELVDHWNFEDIDRINKKESSSILLQYTGLKDKNGKEIFEGDVLSERWKTEVYKNIEGTYMVRFHTNPKANKPLSLFLYLKKREKAGTSETDCIVIGNIHENPELLNL